VLTAGPVRTASPSPSPSPSASPSSPPPPHDPRDRELTMPLEGGWELRTPTARMTAYFLPRGLLHVQLWHPASGVSILTPSRITRGLYEAFPVRRWKAPARSYAEITELVAREHGVAPPSAFAVASLERAFVDELVRTAMMEEAS